jgi:serine/threonine protein kinase
MKLLREQLPGVKGYEIEKKIGEGGAGAIYKGVQLATGRAVAIKIIQCQSSAAKKFARAEREFRSASRLVHPNIVQALDLIRDQAKLYLVMEYVEGQSLGERIEKMGRLSEPAAVAIVTQVGQALHFVHQHGMIHRDVKPDNVLLTRDDKAKLTDFGLVKELTTACNLTDPATALGTPHFMAPEQYTQAKEVDSRCDVFGLGATLYVAVTGQLPFGATRSFVALTEKAKQGAIVPPRQLVPELSENIENAIRQAMSPDAGCRPRTCLAFVKQLLGKAKVRQAGPSRGSGSSRVRPKFKAPEARAERRAAVRYPLGFATDCAVESSLHNGEAEVDNPWPAAVKDLSSTGLALVLSRRLERGTVIVVDLEGPYNIPLKSLQARVVRVQTRGFGQWQIGCQLLEPLSPEDVRLLL